MAVWKSWVKNMETKKDIRKRICQFRENLSTEDVIAKSRLIIEKTLQLPEYKEADNILLYADYRHEVMTKDLFMSSIADRKKVFFPKCNPVDCQMDFYQIISVRQLETGAYGIKEPPADEKNRYHYQIKDNTLIIVPGVAFDVEGNRIGYGKGYYDRYLEKKRTISAVGLCFAEQIVDHIEADQYDIKMDKIVTEEIVYSFLRI